MAAEVDQPTPSAPTAGRRRKGTGASAELDLPAAVMEAGKGRLTWVVEARRRGASEAGRAAEPEVGRMGSLQRRSWGESSGDGERGRQGTREFCAETPRICRRLVVVVVAGMNRSRMGIVCMGFSRRFSFIAAQDKSFFFHAGAARRTASQQSPVAI
jgi:hypothetical protein